MSGGGELSSPADRRLSALARHLEGSTAAVGMVVSASPTSGFNGDSVFAHVARGPEDPILGVSFLSLSLSLFCLSRRR